MTVQNDTAVTADAGTAPQGVLLTDTAAAKVKALLEQEGRTDLALRIRHVGLPLPRVLVCADEIARGKPDPEGYLAAAKRLGHRPDECIVIEDTPPGIEAGHSARMRVVAIAGTYPAAALSQADVVAARLASVHVSRADGQLEVSTADA